MGKTKRVVARVCAADMAYLGKVAAELGETPTGLIEHAIHLWVELDRIEQTEARVQAARVRRHG